MQLSGPDPLPPVAAAAVVPLRDGPGGRLQVLVGRRADSMTYGGQWTFPGGRVDERDADPGAPGDELAAARRAAVREAAEEVGLAFPPSALVPFNHWTGGSGTGLRRLFAAWYFLARAPEGTVVLDGRETLDHRWITPADALAARDRGELSVVAPVWMTLHALVGAGSVAGALALAGADGREPVALHVPPGRGGRRPGGAVGRRRRLRHRRPRRPRSPPSPGHDRRRRLALRAARLTEPG